MIIQHRRKTDSRKRSNCPSFLPAILISLVLAGTLLAGCAGTGTMYTPDTFEDEAEETDAEDTIRAAASAEESTAAPAEEDPPRRRRRRKKREQPPMEAAPDEDPRTLRAELEGSGSDLYTARAVESYYSFTLDDVSLSLPASLTDFEAAGWELKNPKKNDGGQEELIIPSYSFEYICAVPAGDQNSGRQIRLCLANFTEEDLKASSCTVCGISVSQDDNVMLRTTFGTGIGDSLQNLTAVFGTDPSCCTQTQYADGINTVRYHFSNGLYEGETIPVLAEAEDKSLAELMMAETAEDGITIRTLSLYFFRLPE